MFGKKISVFGKFSFSVSVFGFDIKSFDIKSFDIESFDIETWPRRFVRLFPEIVAESSTLIAYWLLF